eukprot:gb/GFBE01080265.1/.p1 GENE.gb/GFBE01080265.1/~~gb/GFBE01080265.1/.p1  ORF type:complete len:169 (+),score=81.72 gb/GFBE01080265.1/:1-507(+)
MRAVLVQVFLCFVCLAEAGQPALLGKVYKRKGNGPKQLVQHKSPPPLTDTPVMEERHKMEKKMQDMRKEFDVQLAAKMKDMNERSTKEQQRLKSKLQDTELHAQQQAQKAYKDLLAANEKVAEDNEANKEKLKKKQQEIEKLQEQLRKDDAEMKALKKKYFLKTHEQP